MIMMEDDLKDINKLILENLPQAGVSLAFGYGSKIVKQSNNGSRSHDMLDFILAIDNPIEWHNENFLINPKHYSFIKYFPNRISLIVDLQQRYGAQIYYNPYVQMGTRTIKYGIIKTEHLIQDLHNWTTLYVSGRLHKPVRYIVDTSDRNKDLSSGLAFNRESAIRVAMLQLPETFKPVDLYTKITGLSYTGDFRMLFGENKNKVQNIVDAQLDKFEALYMHRVKKKESVFYSETKGLFTQDLSPNTVLKNLEALPSTIRTQICKSHSSKARSIESNIILSSVAKSISLDVIVSTAIASVVKRTSLSQSFKGIISAGFLKSLRYSQNKLLKSINSRLRI